MGKTKKGKKADPAKEAAKEQRKAAKAARNLAKGEAKMKKAEARAGDLDTTGDGDIGADASFPVDDLDSILAQFASLDAANDAVLTACLASPPSPRANLSMTYAGGAAGGGDALIYYGGEYYDGRTNICNSDVFVYELSKRAWKQHEVRSMMSMLPTSWPKPYPS